MQRCTRQRFPSLCVRLFIPWTRHRFHFRSIIMNINGGRDSTQLVKHRGSLILQNYNLEGSCSINTCILKAWSFWQGVQILKLQELLQTLHSAIQVLNCVNRIFMNQNKWLKEQECINIGNYVLSKLFMELNLCTNWSFFLSSERL